MERTNAAAQRASPRETAMDIRPPYGYQEIVPLTKHHRVLLPEVRRLPVVFRTLTALPLSYTEFSVACRDYPIAFIGGDGNFIAMAVLGMENQQNLFVTPEGGWDASVYLPAYVRRYPFCMTRVTVDGREQPERVACVEKRAINDKGEALYDAKGEPLPVWDERRKLLFEYEADLVRSDEMSRTLAGLGLLDFHDAGGPQPGRAARDDRHVPRRRAKALRTRAGYAEGPRAERDTGARLRAPDLAREFRAAPRPPHHAGQAGPRTHARSQEAELALKPDASASLTPRVGTDELFAIQRAVAR